MRQQGFIFPLCFLAIFSFLSVSAQILYPDPGFESQPAHDGPVRSGRGSASCNFANTSRYGFWQSRNVTVEPFALYEASIYIQGQRTAGGGNTFLIIHETEFGWDFICSTPLPEKADDWVRQEVQFYGPTNRAQVGLIEHGVGLTGQYYLDDLSIKRLLTAEEHLEKIKNKPNRTAKENALLVHACLKNGQQENLPDFYDFLSTADASTQVVGKGLLIDKITDREELKQQLPSLLMLNPIDNYRGGKALLKRILARLPSSQQNQICLQAVLATEGKLGTAKALALATLPENAPGMTLQQQKIALQQSQEILQQLTAMPNPEQVKAEVKRRQESLEQGQKRLADYQASLGNCKIVIDGKVLSADTHAIVLPTNPSATEEHAAAELLWHLEQITGVSLAIVPETAPGNFLPLIIGRGALLGKYGFQVDYAQLGPEGVNLQSSQGALLLAGSKRNGVLYAVYAFLDEILGCRWFTHDCVHLPRDGQISLDRLQYQFVPELELRGNTYPVSRDAKFAVRNKLNGDQVRLPSPAWGEKVSYAGFVHTFGSLVPSSKYGEDHPEYYSLIDGKRMIEDSQLCLTNPDVLQIALEAVRQRLRRNPQVRIVSVSQNDNQRYCRCQQCQALADHEGSQSGPLLHFVNAIADAIIEEFPAISVDTLAYQYTRKPPLHVRPSPNVIIRLCSIESCFLHPLETCPRNARFIEDILGWNELCKRLHIWDYTVNYSNILLPFPNFEVLQPNIDFFVRHGSVGVFEESTSATGSNLAYLRAYVIAKCLWNRHCDPKQLIREFTDTYYGAAGPYIVAYLELLHRVLGHERDVHVGCFAQASRYLNEPELIDKCLALFDQAEAAVANDETLRQRVETDRIGLMYLKISHAGKKLYDFEENMLKPRASVDLAMVDRFKDALKTAKVTRVASGERGQLENFLRTLPTMAQPAKVEILENDFLRLEIVPDMGGRIWRGTDKLTGDPIFSVYGNAETGFEAFEAGYEEYGSNDYRGLGWQEKYEVVKRIDAGIIMSAKLANGLTMERQILLWPEKYAFQIKSSLKGAKMKNAVMRNHPTFYTPDVKNVTLHWHGHDGTWKKFDIPPDVTQGEKAELWLQQDSLPAGVWAMEDKTLKRAIVNTFRADLTSICYANWNNAFHRCNLEQWSKVVDADLQYGPTMTNNYVIVREEDYPWKK